MVNRLGVLYDAVHHRHGVRLK